MQTNYKLRVFETEKLLNIAAAKLIIEIAHKAIAVRDRFVIALSGGQTPTQLYNLLSEPDYSNQIPWKKVHVFWGDERCVPITDQRNNAYQAKLALLNKIEIPTTNIHVIPVDLSPAVAAKRYEEEIKAFFQEKTARFDLILLGLGENGHTASLFPGTSVINEDEEGIKGVFVQEQNEYRITMTAPLINKARNILFLVTGENKAEILHKILTAPYQPEIYPAQLINVSLGELYWFADSKAASLLNL